MFLILYILNILLEVHFVYQKAATKERYLTDIFRGGVICLIIYLIIIYAHIS